MLKSQVTVADEAGQELHGGSIEAQGRPESREIAARGSATLGAPDRGSGKAAGLEATMNDLVIDGSR